MNRTLTFLLLATLLLVFVSVSQNSLSYSPLSPGWPDEISRWESDINSVAQKYDLPADYLAAIIKVESNGDPLARSSSGSLGLMQIHLSVAEKFAQENDLPLPTEEQLLTVPYNLEIGTAILNSYLTHHTVSGLKEAITRYGPPLPTDNSYFDLVNRVYNSFSR